MSTEYVVVNVDVLMEAAEAHRIPGKNTTPAPAKTSDKSKSKGKAPAVPKGVMTPGEVAGILVGLASGPRVGAQVQTGPPEPPS